MDDLNQGILEYRESVQMIKSAILKSRYQTAVNSNTEMLSLYYGVANYRA